MDIRIIDYPRWETASVMALTEKGRAWLSTFTANPLYTQEVVSVTVSADAVLEYTMAAEKAGLEVANG